MGNGEKEFSSFVVSDRVHGCLAPFSIIVWWALSTNDKIKFSSSIRQCPAYISKIVESGASSEFTN
jgi:hypothetical protein